jgi:hypothetical protein
MTCFRPEIEFDFNAVDPDDWPKLAFLAQHHLRGPLRDAVLTRLEGLWQCQVADEPAAAYTLRVPVTMTRLEIQQTGRALLLAYMDPTRSKVEQRFLFALSSAILAADCMWGECEARGLGLI